MSCSKSKSKANIEKKRISIFQSCGFAVFFQSFFKMRLIRRPIFSNGSSYMDWFSELICQRTTINHYRNSILNVLNFCPIVRMWPITTKIPNNWAFGMQSSFKNIFCQQKPKSHILLIYCYLFTLSFQLRRFPFLLHLHATDPHSLCTVYVMHSFDAI